MAQKTDITRRFIAFFSRNFVLLTSLIVVGFFLGACSAGTSGPPGEATLAPPGVVNQANPRLDSPTMGADTDPLEPQFNRINSVFVPADCIEDGSCAPENQHVIKDEMEAPVNPTDLGKIDRNFYKVDELTNLNKPVTAPWDAAEDEGEGEDAPEKDLEDCPDSDDPSAPCYDLEIIDLVDDVDLKPNQPMPANW